MALILCCWSLCLFRTIPFCYKQLQEWGRLDTTACIEKEVQIEEMIKMGYKVGTIVILFVKAFAHIALLA